MGELRVWDLGTGPSGIENGEMGSCGVDGWGFCGGAGLLKEGPQS